MLSILKILNKFSADDKVALDNFKIMIFIFKLLTYPKFLIFFDLIYYQLYIFLYHLILAYLKCSKYYCYFYFHVCDLIIKDEIKFFFTHLFRIQESYNIIKKVIFIFGKVAF